MASRGPFKATDSDMERARDYLAQRGIDYKGDSPKQAQRLANGLYKQESAGYVFNRAAARGHGSTPEHPGRSVRTFQPAPERAKEQAAVAGKELKVGTTRQYDIVHYKPVNEKVEYPDGERSYSGSAAYAREGVKDAAFLGGRVEVQVTYADGRTQDLFTGADHKRNGTHAIDAATLQEMYQDYLEENPDGDWEDFIDDFAGDEAYEDSQGTGGAVSYTVSFHPY